MKKTLLYIFAAALASVFTLQSCGLEEPFPGPQSGISEGTVEFVARPAGYNNHDVTTKADGDPSTFEDDEIYNAFLLVFNQDGQRLLCEEIRLNAEDGGLSAKIDRSLGNVTACVLANVPADFARSITGRDILNSVVLDLTYDSSKSGILGVPVLDLDNDEDTDPIPCIPMFGQTEGAIDLSTNNSVIQINLTRLFAKVSVELRLNIPSLPDYDRTRFELNSYRLVNLPLKVSLLHQDKESPWVKESGSFAGENSHVVSNIQYKIFNNSYNLAGDQQKKYTFNIYVPEYQLESLPSTTPNYGKQEYKPKMYDSLNKKAVHIVLKGSYIPSSGSSTDLDYSVLLGENESTNFTMNRNVHYTNLLTITGIQKNADNTDEALIDHRVKISDGDMVSMFGEVANCYLISKEGEYSFPAYKGAFKADVLSKEYLCNGNRAEIIYESSETDIVFDDEDGDGNPINVKTDADGTKVIEFKLSKVGADGNVIIAMYDDNGNIEWSWHMWFVTGLQLGGNKTGYFELGTQTLPNGKKMTDRNLGVTANGLENLASGTLTGLYYKYGHKDPYLNQTYLGGGECAEYDWGSNYKSRTDPCPPGYRVPSSDVWKGFTPTNEHSRTPNAFIFWKENTGDINLIDDIYVYYPYSGYINKDNTSETGEGEDKEKTSFKADDYRNFTFDDIRTDEVQMGDIETVKTMGVEYQTQTIGYTEYRYTDFRYEMRLSISKIGYLWGGGKSFFQYYYKISNNWKDFRILQCKCQSRAVTRQQQRFKDKWVSTGKWPWQGYYDWGEWKEYTSETPGEWSAETTLTDASNNVYIDNNTTGTINNNEWQSELKSNQGRRNFSISSGEVIEFSDIPSDSYQVRCVKE